MFLPVVLRVLSDMRIPPRFGGLCGVFLAFCGDHFVAQVDLELTSSLLPQFPQVLGLQALCPFPGRVQFGQLIVCSVPVRMDLVTAPVRISLKV